MTARKSVSGRILKSDLKRMDAHVIAAREYRELPELTTGMLERATAKKGGRPRSLNPRKLITLRLPADVIDRWKSDLGHTRAPAARGAAPRARAV